ncbi:MAG: HAD family hydrolase [Bacteroidetes bacterium]|nr:MAG: HAD family hydrolase [Bacteroidota bacterium]
MKNTDFKLVVFDMAGTVVNEDNVVYKTIREALEKHGFSFSLDRVLAIAGGKEKLEAINDLLADIEVINPPLAESIHGEFKENLKEKYQIQSLGSFEGVESMITRLRDNGIKVVLNTGYDTETATSILKKMKWNKGTHYDALVAADNVVNGRPAPEMIQLAMEQFGINNPSEVVKVGDSIIDIEEGKNAGCGLTIAVTSGAHNENQLQSVQPDLILKSLANLDEVLLGSETLS